MSRFLNRRVLFQAMAWILGVSPSVHAAETLSEVDYGEMYISQTLPYKEKQWLASLDYGYGFSNPYVHTHRFELGFGRRLGDFFAVSLQGGFFLNHDKGLQKEIEANLAGAHISAEPSLPEFNGLAQVTFVPLSGMVNWFNVSPVLFDFEVKLGLGIASYSDVKGILPSIRIGAGPSVMFNPNYGLQLSIAGTFDRFKDQSWMNRIDGIAGFLVRF